MVEEVGKTGAITNQKFSPKGMQLSQLKENKQVYEFFKRAGLSDNNYVYASDIQNIFKNYDKNENGKLSIKEAREMGFEGNRKEVKNAVKVLNEILETELNANDNVYPTKISNTETDYYDKKGTLKYNAQIVTVEDDTVEKYKFFRDGDRNKISSYAEKSQQTGVGVMINYNEAQMPVKEIINNKGNIQTTKSEYDDKNNLKRQTVEIEDTKVTTDFDEQKRAVKIEKQIKGNDISTVTTNQYDDEKQILTQHVKNHPTLLKDGITETESKYKMEADVPEHEWELIGYSEKGLDGQVKRELLQNETGEIIEKRNGYTITTKFHENGKTSTVLDGKETHVIEYDNDGNTYVYVKNGETFKDTAQRVLGKDATTEDVQAFRDLNKDLIQNYGKVEGFNVGEKIRVKGELEYNATNKDILTVNPKDEIKAYKQSVSSKRHQTVDDKNKPVDGKNKPVDDKNKPVDDKNKPVDGKNKPVDGKNKPIDGKNKPVDGKNKPIDGKNKPIDGKKQGATDKTNHAPVITMEINKKALDKAGIKYTVKGNQISYIDKKGRKVIMSYKNGIKTHETAQRQLPEGYKEEELRNIGRFYDKEYKNGVLSKYTTYFDANTKKIDTIHNYQDGKIKSKIEYMSSEEKSQTASRLMQENEPFDVQTFMHSRPIKRRTEYKNGKVARTILYHNGDVSKIDVVENFKNGNRVSTIYRDGNPNEVKEIVRLYPNCSNYVRKTFSQKNPTHIETIYEANSEQTLTPIYDTKGKIAEFVKTDGTTLDAAGNLQNCKLANNLYTQLNGVSDNKKTQEMLAKINTSNIVDVVEGFERRSPNEPLFEYINNEWGSGLGRPVMDPIIRSMVELGNHYGIKNQKLSQLLQNNTKTQRHNYTPEEIKMINQETHNMAVALRNKYKTIIKENL